MDNKKALSFILRTDELLNDFGNITKLKNNHAKKREYKRILAAAQTMQRNCYDPYFFASSSANSDKLQYTCLVCGKVINGKGLGHAVNMTENGLIEGDLEEEFAVSQLKKYLEIEPALSEAEIREALNKDLIQFAKQR